MHFGLALGRRFPDVDYDAFWTRSEHVARIRGYLAGRPPTSATTGLPSWQPFISHDYHFASFLHTLERASRVVATGGGLSLAESRALDDLLSGLGGRTYEMLEQVHQDAVDLAGSPWLSDLAEIYAQHAPVTRGPVLEVPYRDQHVVCDFTVKVPFETDPVCAEPAATRSVAQPPNSEDRHADGQ